MSLYAIDHMIQGMAQPEVITSLHHVGMCHTPMVHPIRIEEDHHLISPTLHTMAPEVESTPSTPQCQGGQEIWAVVHQCHLQMEAALQDQPLLRTHQLHHKPRPQETCPQGVMPHSNPPHPVAVRAKAAAAAAAVEGRYLPRIRRRPRLSCKCSV